MKPLVWRGWIQATMPSDHADDLLHRHDLGAPDIGTRLLEHGGDDIDLLAIENGAQSFEVGQERAVRFFLVAAGLIRALRSACASADSCWRCLSNVQRSPLDAGDRAAVPAAWSDRGRRSRELRHGISRS
jgi:hypothetical protein